MVGTVPQSNRKASIIIKLQLMGWDGSKTVARMVGTMPKLGKKRQPCGMPGRAGTATKLQREWSGVPKLSKKGKYYYRTAVECRDGCGTAAKITGMVMKPK